MNIRSKDNDIQVIDNIISLGIRKGILHLNTIDDCLLTDNTLKLKIGGIATPVNSFSSCSYLGLELDQRLKIASKKAIDDYGTFFSTSRAYLSCRHYQELEELFSQIFGSYPVIVPTTTLAHLAALPVLIGANDAVIIDHQVHNSVSMAVNLLKTKGVHTELVRHNRIDLLEEKILKLKQRYKSIWYLADGIYSMFGDPGPIDAIYDLLNKYPEFHYYADDAHGMSCFGKYGKGYVLGKKPIHERMIVTVSLAKGFGTGGAVIIAADKETARTIRTCGGPLITSGPLQPSVLGAAIASARIHLSPELSLLQEELYKKISFAENLTHELCLPLISSSPSPIFFIGVSLPKLGYQLIEKMLKNGSYLNLGIFPAVPLKNTGVRFTITRRQSYIQIESMLRNFAHFFHEIISEEGLSKEDILKEFKIPVAPKGSAIDSKIKLHPAKLSLEHVKSIKYINKAEWNSMLGSCASYDWDGLSFVEKVFQGNILPENNWDFDYLIVRDSRGTPVLAAPFTTALCKDDLLSSAVISKFTELLRKEGDSYYLTSKILSSGNLISAGKHLFIDYASPYWKQAVRILLGKLTELQESYDANSILLRDFTPSDCETDIVFTGNGFIKINLLDNHVLNLNWSGRTEYLHKLSQFSKRAKRYIKQDILRHEHKFETKWVFAASQTETEHLYNLYLEVNKKSFELNTFKLPYKLFEQIVCDKKWEVMTLNLRSEYDNRSEPKPVAATFSYLNGTKYHFMFVGLDYAYQNTHKSYKQAIFRLMERANELKMDQIILGYTASHVKRMTFGAEAIPTTGYLQVRDNFSMEVLSSMNAMETSLV
jgi:7-keto-8-aminopelargonate synthetase-like enzyme